MRRDGALDIAIGLARTVLGTERLTHDCSSAYLVSRNRRRDN